MTPPVPKASASAQPPAPPPAPRPTQRVTPGASAVPPSNGVVPKENPVTPAPRIPSLPLDSSGNVVGGLPKVMSSLLASNRGVFFGDEHGNSAVVDTLKAQLPTLKAAGVTTLFVEMFLSKDQPVLDKFQASGDKVALKKYLVDHGWDKGGQWVDHLVAMLDEARKNGIKLVAIDREQPADTLSNRLELANPHWTSVIRSTSLKQSPSEKYIVFGGQGHAANYPMNKGVNVRLGIPAIKPADPTFGAKVDPGQVKPNPEKASSDFLFAAVQFNLASVRPPIEGPFED